MTLSNTTRIGQTEHMEVEAEATTMAEIFVAKQLSRKQLPRQWP